MYRVCDLGGPVSHHLVTKETQAFTRTNSTAVIVLIGTNICWTRNSWLPLYLDAAFECLCIHTFQNREVGQQLIIRALGCTIRRNRFWVKASVIKNMDICICVEGKASSYIATCIFIFKHSKNSIYWCILNGKTTYIHISTTLEKVGAWISFTVRLQQ